MHVNVSGAQLLHPKLVSDVAAVIRKSGVDASRLKLEITESVMMTPDDARLLAKLKKLSVSLCVDDFGAGYSSFSYLARFPFDTLKIDKSLIADMARSSECIELVRAIVVMAKALGIRLVAEGVETGTQLMKLRELGCDYAQGYFFGRPISADEATKLIAREVEALDAPIRRVALESPI
jgi:EAL domain-containing protein (putative c-di-GMP-specific phosphodiesterase class I)